MKRANGTGSIVRMKGARRKPYAARVSSRDAHGHVIQKSIGYYEKAAQAQAALDDYLRNVEAGTAPSVERLDMTVGNVFELWSAREFKKLNPASIRSYSAAWRKRVSRFSERKMRSMTIDEWQALIDEDKEFGLSQSSINNDVILIKALYNYSMQRDIVGKDYSKYIEIPAVETKNPRGSLSDTQIAQVEKMAAEGFLWADTVLILCYTGFRVSELLSLTRDSYHEDVGGYLQGGTKTEAGKNRIVPIHPKIRPYVLERLGRSGSTIICDDSGRPIRANVYRKYFSGIAAEIGEPDATPHWCRHTFATLIHQAGIDPLTAKWLMGHSTKSDITEHYTHNTIEGLREAIDRIK